MMNYIQHGELPQDLDDPIYNVLREVPIEMRVNPSEFNIGKELGRGGQGTVYEATLRGRKVAFKRCEIARILERDGPEAGRLAKKAHAKEIYFLLKADHENIVTMLGVLIEDGFPSIVMELAPDGSLYGHLQREDEDGRYDKLEITHGVSNGLAYLHDKDIVHGDLKSLNVLLFGNGIAKLADFGQSRSSDYPDRSLKTTAYNRPKGSLLWMAYELFNLSDINDMESDPTIILTKESDIWAFGMVAYEILTKKLPYHHIRGPGFILDAKITNAISNGQLPKASSQTQTKVEEFIWDILCKPCWRFDPKMRPTATKFRALDRLRWTLSII